MLALLVLAPFLWLLRMSFETNAEIFAFPPRLWFTPDARQLRGAVARRFPRLLRQQRGGERGVHRVSLLVGVPAAYALARMRARSDALSLWILASRMAPPIAFTIPYLPGLPRPATCSTRGPASSSST